MNIDFPFLLLTLTIVSGLIWLFDAVFCKDHPEDSAEGRLPLIVDYAKSFFPVFLIVFLVRAFVFQPFEVPSESLEPTIMPVELLFVSQFAYGFKLPIWNWRFLPFATPQRGDVAVFHYPVNPKRDLIKRVIGVPGDKVSYINKILYINGKKQKLTFIKTTDSRIGSGPLFEVKEYEENLGGIKHKIYVRPDKPAHNFYNLVVPKGEYFMMGDNRDESDDGRFWGFAPVRDFVGKAKIIWWSWDRISKSPRWSRIGTLL